MDKLTPIVCVIGIVTLGWSWQERKSAEYAETQCQAQLSGIKEGAVYGQLGK